ncbi:ATP-binding cassette domain-containing protein [Vallitaleaceae bacterium 9-2]
MIEVVDFSKIYRLGKKQRNELKTQEKYKKAVNQISFKAYDGEIFGLLGPNGAGKTTTLRTLSTLIKPTQGKLSVQGIDVVVDEKSVRSKIGFLTNELKLDKHFTPAYTVEYFGQLHGMKKNQIQKRRQELFEYFGIQEYQHKKISELSTGMTQKLSLVVSLIHDPEVIIFDEPTNGLDIITAKAVTDYLIRLRAEGKLIIISTHIMNVAEKLCDRIGIIIEGKIVAQGNIDDICQSLDAMNLEDAFFKLYEWHHGDTKEGMI